MVCPTVTGADVVIRRVVAGCDEEGLGAGKIGTIDCDLPIPLSTPVKLYTPTEPENNFKC